MLTVTAAVGLVGVMAARVAMGMVAVCKVVADAEKKRPWVGAAVMAVLQAVAMKGVAH